MGSQPGRGGPAVADDAEVARTFQRHQSPLWWLAVGAIFGAFRMILDRGVAMRAELETVI
jgi:hypothetical protein